MASNVGPASSSGRMLTIAERKQQLGLGLQLPAAPQQTQERSSSISTVSMGIKDIRQEEREN